MTVAKRRLKGGKLRAIVAGELRQERRERPVDEVHDARFARAGRVVCRNDLRGDGFNVRRLSRAEKRQPGLSRRWRGGVRLVRGLRDLFPAQWQCRGAKRCDDGVQERSPRKVLRFHEVCSVERV